MSKRKMEKYLILCGVDRRDLFQDVVECYPDERAQVASEIAQTVCRGQQDFVCGMVGVTENEFSSWVDTGRWKEPLTRSFITDLVNRLPENGADA